MTTTINASNSGSGGLVQTADASGILALQTAGTTAVTINASQNVGIGTASPGAKLDVAGGVNVSGQLLAGTSGSVFAPFVNAAYVSGTSNLYMRNLSGVNRIDSYNDPITATYPLQINASQQTFLIADTEQARIDTSGNFRFNSGYGSSATAYGCRAWVNFNGTGTVAIRASGNVSSITDNGNGDYTMNFTSAMPDANYSAVGTAGQKAVAWGLVLFANTGAFATSGLRFITQAPNDVAGDTAFICVAIFR